MAKKKEDERPKKTVRLKLKPETKALASEDTVVKQKFSPLPKSLAGDEIIARNSEQISKPVSLISKDKGIKFKFFTKKDAEKKETKKVETYSTLGKEKAGPKSVTKSKNAKDNTKITTKHKEVVNPKEEGEIKSIPKIKETEEIHI